MDGVAAHVHREAGAAADGHAAGLDDAAHGGDLAPVAAEEHRAALLVGAEHRAVGAGLGVVRAPAGGQRPRDLPGGQVDVAEGVGVLARHQHVAGGAQAQVAGRAATAVFVAGSTTILSGRSPSRSTTCPAGGVVVGENSCGSLTGGSRCALGLLGLLAGSSPAGPEALHEAVTTVAASASARTGEGRRDAGAGSTPPCSATPPRCASRCPTCCRGWDADRREGRRQAGRRPAAHHPRHAHACVVPAPARR